MEGGSWTVLKSASLPSLSQVIATYTKNILDAVFGSLVAFAWGFYLAYGINPLTTPYDDYATFCAFFHHLVFQVPRPPTPLAFSCVA